MDCKFNWRYLPQKIRDKFLIDLKYNFFRLPTEINKFLREKEISDINCYLQFFKVGEKVNWRNLLQKLNKICGLIDCTPTYLNTFTFNTGTAPTLVDFETAIGFPLVDGFTDGTVVSFNNTGYTIADNAFNSNVNLLNIATASNVAAGNYSFSGCSSLTSTGSITTAGGECFLNCSSLISTGNITTAGDACFESCTSLTSTVNVLTVGNTCFLGCISLTNMNFSNCNNFGTTTGYNYVFDGIIGLTINLTAKAIHQTSNGGGMEGDLAYLFANNTVNVTWV